jgi:glutathione S-transferase
VRLLAHELGVDYTLRPIHDLMSLDPATYAGNPALKLPAARRGDAVVWGSLNACRLVAQAAEGGPGRVFWPEDTPQPLLMNAHEVLAHAMAAQVEVVFHEIVSRRPEDPTSRKRRASLIGCLAWLDAEWAPNCPRTGSRCSIWACSRCWSTCPSATRSICRACRA